MKNTFFPAALILVSQAPLFAQNPATTLRSAGLDDSTLGNLVSQLQQNALLALLGMVILMGLAWLFCIWNACAGLNSKPKNAPAPSLPLLLLVAAGLSVFGSSCSAAQQAQAADIQAARAAEGSHCVCHAPFDNRNYYRNSGLNNRYPSQDYSNDTGRPFCRQCGQRIYYRNR